MTRLLRLAGANAARLLLLMVAVPAVWLSADAAVSGTPAGWVLFGGVAAPLWGGWLYMAFKFGR